MKIHTCVDRPTLDDPEGLYLRYERAWNDYRWRTLFSTWLVLSGKVHDLGLVKVLDKASANTRLLTSQDSLPQGWISAPVDVSFYHKLEQLGVDSVVCAALRDIRSARDALSDPLVRRTLLRSPGIRNLYADGDIDCLVAIDQTLEGFDAPHRLSIELSSTNRIGALVGPNGSGKTQILNAIVKVYAGFEWGAQDDQSTAAEGSWARSFDRVIALAFSAFDDMPSLRDQIVGVPYAYWGLRSVRSRRDGSTLLSVEALGKRCQASVRAAPERRHLWTKVTDIAFPTARLGVVDLLDPWDDWESFWHELQKAGSGHRLAALSLLGLATSLEQSSLVLIDEPEAHLHPALTASTLRSIRFLLEEHNSYAIVATHSALVLQEVPGRCVRRLDVCGSTPLVANYEGDTFGASLSEINEHAFSLQGSQINFRNLLERWIAQEGVDATKKRLGESPSAAARIILRASKRA